MLPLAQAAYGTALHLQGKDVEATSSLEAALRLSRAENHTFGAAFALSSLGVIAIRAGDHDNAVRYLEESVTLFQQLRNFGTAMLSVTRLGQLALKQGDAPKAVARFRDVLRMAKQVGRRQALADGLAGFALALSAIGNSQGATHLLGAAEQLRETLGPSPLPAGVAPPEDTLKSLNAQLGDELFQRLWSEGRNMPLDDVLEYAASLSVTP